MGSDREKFVINFVLALYFVLNIFWPYPCGRKRQHFSLCPDPTKSGYETPGLCRHGPESVKNTVVVYYQNFQKLYYRFITTTVTTA